MSTLTDAEDRLLHVAMHGCESAVGDRETAIRRAVESLLAARAEQIAQQIEAEVEWAVAHSQGIFRGHFNRAMTEKEAREWMADSIARDKNRRREARGKQRLLRRTVTPWEEVTT